MYDTLAGWSEKRGGWVRLLVLPVVATEALLKVATDVAEIAETIIKALANILGGVFCSKYEFGQGVNALSQGIVTILIAPLYFAIVIPWNACMNVVSILLYPQLTFSTRAMDCDRQLSNIKGEDWYSTLRGQSWLTTPEGREHLKTAEGLSWLITPTGVGWLRTPYGAIWRKNTPEGRKWLETEEGKDVLRYL